MMSGSPTLLLGQVHHLQRFQKSTFHLASALVFIKSLSLLCHCSLLHFCMVVHGI